MSSISSFRMSSKPLKILKRIGIGIGITLILIVVAGEVLLQTGALTGLVNRYASAYVDGELHVGRVTGSLLRRSQVPLSSLPALAKPAPGTKRVWHSLAQSASDILLSHSALGSGRAITIWPNLSSFW